MENKDLYIDKIGMITKRGLLNEVITSTEASTLLKVDKSYILKLIKKGEFEDWEYRKTDKVVLFNKSSIVNRIGKFKSRKK